MRKALHIHALIQLLGFTHPSELISMSYIKDVFKRLWYFTASITFRSTEAFANYLGEEQAMGTLASSKLLPLTPKQRGMIGETRVQESITAQLKARGIEKESPQAPMPKQMSYYVSRAHIQNGISSVEWARKATELIFSATTKSGNHVSTKYLRIICVRNYFIAYILTHVLTYLLLNCLISNSLTLYYTYLIQ